MLFNIAAFIYIFLLFNREFVPFVDLRYINFVFLIILILNKLIYLLKYKSLTIVGTKSSIWAFVALVVLVLGSNIGWFANPYSPDTSVMISVIVLYLYNILAIVVFSLYWRRYNLQLFKYFFLVSGLVLFLSLVMQFIGMESLPFQGQIKSGMEEEEAVFGLRYGGYAQDQNYATIGMVIWVFTVFLFFKKSIFRFLVLAAAVLGILLSFSKTIILIVFILVFYFIAKYFRLHLVYVLTMMVVGGLLFVSIFDLLMSLPTISTRVFMWKSAILEFAQSPIFGNGISSVRSNFLYRGGWYVQPHNSFVAILVDHGLLGLTLYITLIIFAFKTESLFYKYLLVVFVVFSFTQELFVFQYPYFLLGILPMIINCLNGKQNFVELRIKKKDESVFSS
jgi:O-antigen ligase